MGRNDMPRRSQFRTQEAYERARRRKIMELRRRKRKIRQIVKCCILAGMAAIAILICVGVGLGVKAIVNSFSKKSVTESVLAQRYEVMPDISTVHMEEDPVPTLDLVICLDPGHGGYDPGTSSTDGSRQEKDDALSMGLALQQALQQLGAQVVMTRSDDTFISLGERGQIANQAGADYFVSIHRNAIDKDKTNADPQGIEIFVPTSARENPDGSFELGQAVMTAMESVGISENRGVRYGSQGSENSDYQVNRDTGMPSCLIEMGFMTNETDNQLLDEHLNDYAKAVAKAIVKLATDDGEEEPPRGMVLENEKIQDVESLSNEEVIWAPGSKTDENNRPVGALDFQEKYGDYQASFIVPDGEGELYLTFDEGYGAGYTEEILDVLKERDLSAVFFVTLPFAKSNEQLIQRMIDEGHIIGNHSAYNSKDGIVSQSLEDQRTEVKELHDYMLDHFNYQMCLFRYPNGRFSEQSLAMVNNLDYQSVFWSFSYNDYEEENQPKPDDALKTMLKQLHGGAIYLMSARSSTNAQILDQFITGAQSEGYHFGTYSVKSSAVDQGGQEENSTESPDGSSGGENGSESGESGGSSTDESRDGSEE